VSGLFIQTVEEAAPRIADEGLQAEVAGFIAQESQHRIGHSAL
jgi:predicted metal-dependent hydrolase